MAIIFETTFETYRSSKLIGEGGSGRVFEVESADGSLFAAKILAADIRSTVRAKRFRNELNFCLAPRSPYIIRVLDHGLAHEKDAQSPFYLMPLYEGSLRDVLKSGIRPEEIPGIFARLLDGVEAAHLLGAVHRDIKPENFLSDGNGLLVLADFGIAQFNEEDLITAVETKDADRLANFQYAAPEQRTRGREVDYRADIYALGLMLNEMFTGEIPQGTGYRTIGAISEQYAYLDDLVEEMIRQSPDERPGSIGRIKNQLVGLRDDFVALQRINELEQTVVPIGDVSSDPLIADPPSLEGADWDPELKRLVLNLSQDVNGDWIWAFNNMGGYSAVMGHDPGTFKFSGRKAVCTASEGDLQRIVDHFKQWLPKANQVYKNRIEAQQKEEERRMRETIEREIGLREAKRRVNRNLRI